MNKHVWNEDLEFIFNEIEIKYSEATNLYSKFMNIPQNIIAHN